MSFPNILLKYPVDYVLEMPLHSQGYISNGYSLIMSINSTAFDSLKADLEKILGKVFSAELWNCTLQRLI